MEEEKERLWAVKGKRMAVSSGSDSHRWNAPFTPSRTHDKLKKKPEGIIIAVFRGKLLIAIKRVVCSLRVEMHFFD